MFFFVSPPPLDTLIYKRIGSTHRLETVVV